MRISELIEKLEAMKTELGDLEVLAPAREDGNLNSQPYASLNIELRRWAIILAQ